MDSQTTERAQSGQERAPNGQEVASEEPTVSQTDPGYYVSDTMPQVVEEFAFDAALFKGMLDTGEQAAREMGQWMDKHEVSGTGKGRAIPVIVLPAIVPGKPMQEIEPHMKTTWFGLPA